MKGHNLFSGSIADAVGGWKIAGNVRFSCCICTIQWFGGRPGIPFTAMGNLEMALWVLIMDQQNLNSQTQYAICCVYSGMHSV